MSRAAVICEFNPFHNGHKFLLENIKSSFADETVCVMSGNFVQRGDIAITDKYARAKAALSNGADIVAELPTVYAVSNAQTFAENGIRMAWALNCDMLCFGAESGIDELTDTVRLLESDEINEKIKRYMDDGYYYPKAVEAALGESYSDIIRQPNNILAVEYIKACKKYGITPIAVKRKGAAHDDSLTHGNIASASKIRELIINGEDYERFTPMRIDDPVTLSALESAILYKLKTISEKDLARIADVSEGLENRIIDAARKYNSINEILSATKTKRYTMARLRRIMICALLDITSKLQDTPVPYLRILGIKSGKESIISNAKLPLIVKTKADYERLDNSLKEIFDTDLRAAEAMNTAKRGEPINEFTQQVIKL